MLQAFCKNPDCSLWLSRGKNIQEVLRAAEVTACCEAATAPALEEPGKTYLMDWNFLRTVSGHHCACFGTFILGETLI